MNKYILWQTSCQQIVLDQIIIRVKLKLDQCEQINQRKKKAKEKERERREEEERRDIEVK